jgi:hypothetical protein
MVKKKSTKILVYLVIMTMISAMFITLSPVKVSAIAATYYVDAVNGNDTTGNGSSGSPWKTISKAAGIMVAGDTCKIRTGTYRETVTPANSGSPGNDITFMPDTGATVKVVAGRCIRAVSIKRQAPI